MLTHDSILLIDDRLRNCEAWRRAGGAAVRRELGRDPLDDLGKAVDGWLGQREQLAARAASDRAPGPGRAAAGGAR